MRGRDFFFHSLGERAMSGRAARITQADVARVLRAAKQVGAPAVEVRPDGSVLVRLVDMANNNRTEPVEDVGDIVL